MTKKKTFVPGSVITYTPGRNYRVKLLGKVLTKGRQSLYLSHYKGAEQPRSIEYLNIIIKTNPVTQEDREYNKESMALAMDIREKRESILKHKAEGLKSPHLKRMNFIDYSEAFVASYTNKDLRLVKGCHRRFLMFIESDLEGQKFIAPHELEGGLAKGFRDYLLKNLRGETPLNYFTKFKKICQQAVKDGLLSENPCEGLTIPRDNSVKKAIISYDEMILLSKTPCYKEEVKRAFLFACNTALGFSELKSIKWADIDLTGKKLLLQRDKVRHSSNRYINHLDLNTNAISLLGTPGRPDEPVFNLRSYENESPYLKKWVQESGITKNVTWHSARHSVATNLLASGVDLKTVSSILTHATIKHTTKYLHLVDELKKNALEAIPSMQIEGGGKL